MTQKQIVILGAGFGGIAAAKELIKQNRNFQITIIDRYPHHTIHGQLYEVATSPDELTSLPELKQSVEVPLSEIFPAKFVRIVVGDIEGIDLHAKVVTAANRKINYDFLVCALGSQPNFFAIPGSQDYALPFMSSYDALRIRGKIEASIQLAKTSLRHHGVNIIVAGGGVGGTEIAGELHGMLDYLSWRENYPREKIHVTIIDRGSAVLSSFPEKVQQTAAKRLQALSVTISTGTTIQSITKNSVLTDKGELPCDVLIWSAGVRANPLPTIPMLITKKGDRIEVDEYFRPTGFPNVFIIGDQCCRLDSSGNPLPGTASQAIDHAEYVAKAVTALAMNRQPEHYACRSFPFIVPLGAKWAIFSSGSWMIAGYFGYLIRQVVWLRYYISIMGFRHGVHWLLRTGELFSRND